MADAALVVRVVHVGAAALLVGGAASVAASGAPAALARRFEAAFWPGVAVSVATGVGNLGAGFGVGDVLLAPKLVGVLLVLLASLARLALVVAGAPPRALAAAYAATAVLLGGVLVLAVVLAHA